jgi:hypothetical protein
MILVPLKTIDSMTKRNANTAGGAVACRQLGHARVVARRQQRQHACGAAAQGAGFLRRKMPFCLIPVFTALRSLP